LHFALSRGFGSRGRTCGEKGGGHRNNKTEDEYKKILKKRTLITKKARGKKRKTRVDLLGGSTFSARDQKKGKSGGKRQIVGEKFKEKNFLGC